MGLRETYFSEIWIRCTISGEENAFEYVFWKRTANIVQVPMLHMNTCYTGESGSTNNMQITSREKSNIISTVNDGMMAHPCTLHYFP